METNTVKTAPWWPVLAAIGLSACGLILANESGAIGVGLYFAGAIAGAYYLFDAFSRGRNFFMSRLSVATFGIFLLVATLIPLMLFLFVLGVIVDLVACFVGSIWAYRRYRRNMAS